MPIRNTLKGLVLLLAVLTLNSDASVVSRVTSFSDGDVLFASDLNSEFNNLVDNMNALDNDNLSSSANISASKLSATLAGSGLTRNGTTGALSVSVDDSTTAISSNNVIVKTNGVGNSQLRQGAALSVIGNSTNSTANVADITAGTDGYVLRRSGTTLGFGTIARSALPTVGQQTSSSSGEVNTSSSSFVDVTNLSVSITTTGRPVILMAISAITDTTLGGMYGGFDLTDVAVSGKIAFLRDGSILSSQAFGSSVSGSTGIGNISVPCSSLQHIDAPAAGTYTYKMQYATQGDASDTIFFDSCKLVAFEL